MKSGYMVVMSGMSIALVGRCPCVRIFFVMIKKNDVLTLKIEDMGVDGEGIGKVENVPLFVKDALIGDVVSVKVMKMKKHYGYARMLEILEPSKDRVTPRCEFHRACGGCQIQALSYDKQLEFKERKIRNNLKRIGGFSEELLDEVMEPIIGMEEPYHYRNKAQFPVGKDRDGRLVTGFYAGRTHTIIPNGNCLLGMPMNERILDVVLGFMEEYGIEPYDEKDQSGVVRHVLTRYGRTTGEWMVCVVINQEELPHGEALVEELCKLEGMKSISVNVNRRNTNVILGEEVKTLWGEGYITDYIHLRTGEDWKIEGEGIAYQISPQSFYQVNPVQTEKLYSTALEYAGLTGEENVWDLYCGIGTISLFLAQKARKVSGVEIVPQAIEDARNNARINGIENTEFFVGKAEEVLPERYRMTGEKADVIVVDPPRKGCDERCLETIVKMEPERVVYVSCDSATLGRDLRYLCERGYELRRGRGCDMFGHSGHVETVVMLSKLKSNHHIEVDIKVDEMDLTSCREQGYV